MNKHNIFKPNHPAVSYQLRSNLLWAKISLVHAGGVQCSANWLKYRYTPTNDTKMIAQITFDFQHKN